jgi:hypothetical protein
VEVAAYAIPLSAAEPKARHREETAASTHRSRGAGVRDGKKEANWGQQRPLPWSHAT